MAFSNRGRTKKGRSRGKKGSRHTSDESDLLKGIDGPERIQTNARNTEGDEYFSEASNTRRGRSGKIEDLSKGDAAHLKGQNDTQQFMQQSQNDVVKEGTLAQVCKTSRINSTQSTRYPKHPVSNDAGGVRKYTTVSQFLQLHDATPEKIASELLLDLKSFQKVILNSQNVRSQNDMHKILTILLKLTKIGAIQILSEAFNSRSHQFCSKLQQYVTTINTQREFLTVIELFDKTLALLPQAWNFLPVDKLVENISKILPLLQDDTKCMSMVSTYQNEQKCSEVSMEENYCEYKTTSILPLTSEINNEMVPLKLRPNIVDGCYESWEHYYDTQFKLLKEDFVASLRRGICDFRKEEQTQNTPDNKVWKIPDIRVYDNVKFTGLRFSTNGITLTIQFDCSKLRKVNWEHSKRLIYGSLLCFSCNNFETVMFASVVERDCRMLQRGKVTVKMESNEDILYLSLNSGDFYTMIESQAHYETYYHILRSLQTAESDIMPFTNILIESNCCHVQPPAYMCPIEMRKSIIKHPLPIFDMCDALGMSSRQQSIFGVISNSGSTQGTFNISKPECWPRVKQVQLDQSQLEAIRMALTQRVSVIQGPPGTGKTYIGLKIVQALLINRGIWDPPRNSPLLVVCYTNHALDQFLEGIIDLNERDESHRFSIARVGGRCKSEKVAKYNIKNIEIRKAKVPKSVHWESRKIKDRVESMGTELDYKYKVIQGKVHPTANNLREFIAPIHWSQLNASEGAYHGSTELSDRLNFWLSCEDMNQYEIATEETADTTLSSLGDRHDTLSGNSDSEESPATKSKVNVDNTISVVSQAEIAEAHRRIDEPETVFHYVETADHDLLDTSMLTHEIEISPLTKEFLTIPDGPLTHTTMSLIDDIFNLKRSDRIRLFKYWKGQYIEKLCNKLRANFEGYTAVCKEYTEAKQQEDFYILDTVDLIGMTTTGAAKYQHIIQKIKPKIVIVEEAAEVLESYIVSCLTAATQQLILIGDHKQLRPNPNEYYLAQNYNLDISLFERLIRAGIPHATLQTQHRMRPEIAGLVCPSIYPTLDNHESVLKYERIKGVGTSLHFFNHKHPETSSGDTKSYSNVEEARLVVGLCDYFLKQDYSPSQITVLTTYTGQLLKLKSLMPRNIFEGVRITVVDNFQGEENDIIILSLVRSNKNRIVGFLKIENRICVALSRARKGFFCFGNFDLLRRSCDTWESIVEYMESIGKLESSLVLCCFNHPEVKTIINTVDDFKNVPNGGCKRPCNTLLDCGHRCTMICHIKDPSHQNYKCTRRCEKTCEYGHQCSSVCYTNCPPCIAAVKKIIPYCGHENMVSCSQDPQKCMCTRPCEKQLPCGHTCAKPCGAYMCTQTCMVKVQKTLHCEHTATVPCSKPVNTVYCWEQVLKTLPCGHETLMDCSQSVDEYECQFKVEKPFPSCEHSITLPCSTPIDIVSCQAQVCKKLPCGHKAVLDCSQSVDEYSCQFEVEKQFPDCKHSITLPCSTPIAQVSCSEEVSKQLPCGRHEILVKCSESVNKRKCKAKMKKQFPNCEHSITLACSTPVDEISCTEIVTKQLPCGHDKVLTKCSEKCQAKVERKFPDCEHLITLPCSTCIDEAICKENVQKNLPCGHQVNAQCYISVDELKCRQKSKVMLECGHTYNRKCGKPPMQKCSKIVSKKFPLCEHEIEMKCCDTLPPNCTAKCTVKLLCGHQCTGNCTKCYQGRMHKPCPFQMFPLPCGHYTREPCTSMRFPLCEYNCEYSCAHHNCTHPCSQSCGPCKQPCSWACKHYKCVKKCHDICDRPRCDRPCGHKLQCRHPCIGICGEHCPRVCRICPNQKRKLQELYTGTAPISSHGRYIQLSCNHLFEVEELDQLLAEQFEEYTVEPLVCPFCRKQIRFSHRYGNLIKKKKEMLRKLRNTMTEPVSAQQQAATIKKVSKFIPSHMHTEGDAVPDTLLVSMLKKFTQLLPPIFQKVSSLFTSHQQKYENLIIENEADLYAYLKDMHKRYPESSETSTSLQELIVFFEKAPASAQKSHDVLSEALRIFVLQMASSLSPAIPQTGEDYVVIKELTEKLRVDQPRLSVSALTNHFDRLQKMAERFEIRIDRVDLKCLQPTKAANFTNGVWIICSNGHLFCRPRGLSNKETWQCPDCSPF